MFAPIVCGYARTIIPSCRLFKSEKEGDDVMVPIRRADAPKAPALLPHVISRARLGTA